MTNSHKSFLKYLALTLLAVASLLGCQSTGQDGKPLTTAEIIQKRDATLKMSRTGLEALIKQKPDVQKEIDQAAGYAVFTIDGRRGGIDVDANFSAGSGGTIRSFNPEITFYTVGLSGYDLQANYGGTLYLVDQQINSAATLDSLPKKKPDSK